jgi:hypothetical protein
MVSPGAKGYLLAVNDADGIILKITLKNPSVTIVKIDLFFPDADGILLQGNTPFLIQHKGINKVFEIESVDDWNTARLVAATALEDGFQNPSTLTTAGSRIYALNAKLNELSDSTLPRSKEFSLQLVECKPVQ